MSTRREDTPWLDMDLANLEGEEWRAVVGFEGTYEVSNYGRVKSLHCPQPRLLKQSLNGLAVRVCLSRPGGARTVYAVRHLVVRAFGLQKPAPHVWTHAGSVREDNRVANITSLSVAALHRRSHARGLRPQSTAFAGQRRAEQQARDREVGIYAEGGRVAQRCADCGQDCPVAAFRNGQAGSKAGPLGRVCFDCLNRRRGTRQPGKSRLGRELAGKGLRRCTLCQEPRPLDDQHFRPSKDPKMHGYTYACFTCKPMQQKRVRAAGSGGSKGDSPPKT